MNRKTHILLALTAVVTGALVLSPSPAQATGVTIDQVIYQSGTGVNPALLSGTLDITVTGANQLTILMTNTSPNAAFTSSGSPSLMLLTGFGLQLSGVTITGGTVTVNSGSTALNFDVGQSTTNISNQWQYSTQAIDGYGMTGVLPVDDVVSSVNNGAAAGRFAPGPPVTIGGPGYGALSSFETQFGSSQPGVQNTIRFVLNLSGAAPSVADIDAGNVVLAFGSPNAVPDGGTTAALLGGALLGLGILRRKLGR